MFLQVFTLGEAQFPTLLLGPSVSKWTYYSKTNGSELAKEEMWQLTLLHLLNYVCQSFSPLWFLQNPVLSLQFQSTAKINKKLI
jgi:hypothetical protein